MNEEPIGNAEDLEALADEVEAGRGPVALVRPGHSPVVLVSAEEWRRLDELESAESTAWWRRDAAERYEAADEDLHEGEDDFSCQITIDQGVWAVTYLITLRSARGDAWSTVQAVMAHNIPNRQAGKPLFGIRLKKS